MSDTTTQAENAPQEAAQAPSEVQATPDTEQAQEQTPEKVSLKDRSADELVEIIADLRKEAANYRTKHNELKTKFAEAKTPEEFAAATAEFAKENHVLRAKVAAQEAGLPVSMAARLTGETDEELLADAKELAKLFSPAPARPARELRGGLNPQSGDTSVELDPAKLAASVPRS